MTVSVQRSGSTKHSITAEDTQAALQRAFDAWEGADCGSGSPSLRFELSEPVECAAREYNDEGGNANTVMFLDDAWPYPGAGDAFGLTLVSFGTKTGRIWDADIEINGTVSQLSLDDPVESVDLHSVLTHEMGHFLGLDHTLMLGSTMFANYELGDDSIRTLEEDDVAGICAIYPPERKPGCATCEPRGGFSPLCGAEQQPGPVEQACQQSDDQVTEGGCALGGRRGTASTVTGALVGLLLMRLGRRARSWRLRSPGVCVKEGMRPR